MNPPRLVQSCSPSTRSFEQLMHSRLLPCRGVCSIAPSRLAVRAASTQARKARCTSWLRLRLSKVRAAKGTVMRGVWCSSRHHRRRLVLCYSSMWGYLACGYTLEDTVRQVGLAPSYAGNILRENDTTRTFEWALDPR